MIEEITFKVWFDKHEDEWVAIPDVPKGHRFHYLSVFSETADEAISELTEIMEIFDTEVFDKEG